MMLCADAIRVVRNATSLLNNVTAQFPTGKVTAILGPNGAGKSTLLSCLAGIDRPTSGRILLDDKPIHKLPARERARTIGLLPQGGELHWDITARQLVALGQMPYQGNFGLSPDGVAKIDGAMAATDTAQYGDRNMLSLSGGERARVLLARVLAGEPKWLLADEPLANLDPGHQIDMLNLLRIQADTGTGVIVVLHDLNQASAIADHVVLLSSGSVAASGAAESVLTHANLANVFGIDVAISNNEQGHLQFSVLGRKR
jgi:ABC-type cobalamin/Fe3+-siderophores transport system ATPase subunit